MATRKGCIKRLRKAEERAALAIEAIASRYAKFDQDAVRAVIEARKVVRAPTAHDAAMHFAETVAAALAAMGGLEDQDDQDDQDQ